MCSTKRTCPLDDGIAHVHDRGILVALDYDAVMPKKKDPLKFQ